MNSRNNIPRFVWLLAAGALVAVATTIATPPKSRAATPPAAPLPGTPAPVPAAATTPSATAPALPSSPAVPKPQGTPANANNQAAPIVSTVVSERFGTLHLIRPASPPSRAALLFSGDDGWSPAMAEIALDLARQEVFVAGVETPVYREQLKNDDEDCLYIAGEIERLSQSAESGAGLPEFIKPSLLGFSSGATLVYAALAQHAEAFVGGVAFSFCPIFDIPTNFCPDDHLSSQLANNGVRDRVEILPTPGLELNLSILQGINDPDCRYDRISKFFSQMPSVRVTSLPGATHEVYDAPPFPDLLFHSLQHVEAAQSRAENSSALAAKIADLPLVEVSPADESPKRLAIFFSGDGGWATIDKELGAYLAGRGTFVVGWSCLSYFWTSRSPEQTAADLSRVIEHYAKRFHPDQLVVLGYSLGAEIVPFAINRLPQPVRKQITHVVLLSPEKTTDFEIHITDWVGYSAPETQRSLDPEMKKLADLPVLCVLGEDEAEESGCPLLAGPRVMQRQLEGGHHFDGDYERLGSEVMSFLSAPPTPVPAPPSALQPAPALPASTK